MGRFRGYAAMLRLAVEREEARREGNYAKSDDLRRELNDRGVRVDDNQHQFFTPTGLMGAYDLHYGITFEEVQLMCLDREEARRESDFQEADVIRNQLHDSGVILDDKVRMFTMPDGQQGSYDLHHFEREGAAAWGGGGRSGRPEWPPPPAGAWDGPPHGLPPPRWEEPPRMPYPADRGADRGRGQQRMPPPPPPPPGSLGPDRGRGPAPGPGPGPGMGPGGPQRFRGYLEVLRTAVEREERRKAKDYQGADRLREVLNRYGAVLNDTTKSFTLGSLDGAYDLHQGFSFREVQFVCLEREEARREKDYQRSDFLRDWLNEQQVSIEDRSHTFTMGDGTVGSYDLYNFYNEPLQKRQRRY